MDTTTETRSFPAVDVLSITTEIVLGDDDNCQGMLVVLSFMAQEPFEDWVKVKETRRTIIKRSQAAILAQHPQLKVLRTIPDHVDPEDWAENVQRIIGRTLELTPIGT
jgi:hypothetical protein